MTRKSFGGKKLIVFDLDGTLTWSKAPIEKDMVKLFSRLLHQKMVAVIGGGKYEQFKNQFVRHLPKSDELFKKLFIFPTCSTEFYRLKKNGWQRVYSYKLSATEKKKIKNAFKKAFAATNYKNPKKIYGVVIEDRGTQITFSAAGQKTPLKVKEEWNKNSDVRPKLMKVLIKLLPKFEVRQGGLTSIDVTRKGIDKAYGIRQIEKILHVPRRAILFVGDAIFPGGNDYAVVKTGVDYLKVKNPVETKKVINKLLVSSF